LYVPQSEFDVVQIGPGGSGQIHIAGRDKSAHGEDTFLLGAQLEHLGLEFVQNGIVGLIYCRLALQHGDLLLLQLLLLEGLYGVVAIQA